MKIIKRIITLGLVLSALLTQTATISACKSAEKAKNEVDITDKIFIGSAYFETQAVAEALLTSKDVPYIIADGGTTSGKYLAEVVSAVWLDGDNIEYGYYVNKGETVVLKVFTFIEPTPALSETPPLGDIENHDEIPPVTDVPSEVYLLKVHVNFIANLVFSTYDVDLYVDDQMYATLTHGNDADFELSLDAGEHQLTFSKNNSPSVGGTVHISISDDMEIFYKISCYSDKVSIDDVTQYSVVITQPSVVSVSETPVATPTISGEELDLIAINNSKGADADKQFVGITYRVYGIVEWAAPPDDTGNALIAIETDVQAKGMGGYGNIELNLWLTPEEFERIGGISCDGKEIEVYIKLTEIDRSISTNPDVNGYPFQLIFGYEDLNISGME